MMASEHAAASHLPLRFRPRHHLHTGCVIEQISVIQNPNTRSAGFKCAAACNVGPATFSAFVGHGFDFPFAISVLYARAGITALGVQRAATAHFTRAIINAVDAGSKKARCAGDEHDVACGLELRARDGGQKGGRGSYP